MENQVITERVEKKPEQLEAEMLATRESITEKVAALENHVVDTVQNAATALTDTVDAVKSFVGSAPETVEHMADAVKKSVQSTFDISSRIRDNPWVCVGISVGIGCVASFLLSSRERAAGSTSPRQNPPAPPESSSPPRSFEKPSEPGLVDDLLSTLGRKVRDKVKAFGETAIDAAANAINSNMQDVLPKLVDEAARKLMPEKEDKINGFDGSARIYGR
jgi:ElaB/YqjD/DUF883 family membrane-anchored ribosome-binding protein